MSIATLHQVYDESRRLAIAGSQLAKGDFRLQRLIAPLQKSGAKSPVFAKVAAAVEKVVESPEKESPIALMDLVTLVSAILYTQGETGAKGTLSDLKNTDLGIHSTRATARVLAPLLEALTTTGSGRLEIIRDAEERGAFKDLRLVMPALGALDDVYGEIADLVTDKVLPQYGDGILAAVKQTFDLKGKGGHARRLRLMHKIDPKGSRATVLDAFENGSKEVKISAIACLGGSKDDLPLLLEQSKARAKEVRAAALEGLAAFKDKDAVEALKEALKGSDIDLAVKPVRINRSPALLTYVLEEAKSRLESLVGGKLKKQQAEREASRFVKFLSCLEGKTDKKTEGFLTTIFKKREALAKAGVDDEIIGGASGFILLLKKKEGHALLAGAIADTPPSAAANCFMAYSLSKSPKATYKALSSYLLPPPKGRSKADDARLRSEALEGVLTKAHAYVYTYYSSGTMYSGISDLVDTLKWDSAWLDLAIEHANTDLVIALASLNSKNKKLHAYLPKAFAVEKKEHYRRARILEAMIQIGHKGATDLLIEGLKKVTRSRYDGWSYFSLVSQLPKKDAPKIEALMKELPEHMVDDILPHYTELKTSKS